MVSVLLNSQKTNKILNLYLTLSTPAPLLATPSPDQKCQSPRIGDLSYVGGKQSESTNSHSFMKVRMTVNPLNSQRLSG